MKKKTVLCLLVLASLLAVCLIAARLVRGGGSIVRISVNGAVVERIDLTRVREPYDFELATEYGRNLIHVEPGAISVTQSDCPDGICMSMGRLEAGGGMPIICMPHRLILELEDDGIDA